MSSFILILTFHIQLKHHCIIFNSDKKKLAQKLKYVGQHYLLIGNL